MVRQISKWLNQQSLIMQVLAISVIASVALAYLKGPEGAFIDLWLTHDQQGRRLYEDLAFPEAAEKFYDTDWKGTAQYRSGQYVEAAETFGRISSAEGFFKRGNALMHAFEYRTAIAAYEQAVTEAPDWPEAQENYELAIFTLEYIEQTREQSDTGEAAGIGADDVVYDNESQAGEETEVTRESVVEAQSAEMWMRSVDTETADFLRSRFLLEASRRGKL